MKQDILDQVQRIHFIGIGGSGMCPIAEILHHEGFELTGSDMNESDTLDRIRGYGIPVCLGHDAKNLGNAQLVVYTAAIKGDNPELLAAKERGIPVVERAQMLGVLTRRYQNSIAVSGTHGKTTTTAMITQLCIDGGKDPSAVIGGRLPYIGGNGRVGKSEIMVCEACEYVDTFLQLTPAVSVILNIEADHLDYFGTLENIITSFHRFSAQTGKVLIVNGDDPNALQAVQDITNARVITFGFGAKNDYRAAEECETPGACESFVLYHNNERLSEISLTVPGRHNVYNALAAAAVADYLGIDPQTAADSLHRFTGVHRRFEILGKFNGITVADDFAHHPTELTATLTAASQMGFGAVWALFQPHTFSRTYLFLEDFAKALAIPEHVVLLPILAVRETNTYNIYTSDLAAKIPGSVCLDSFEEMAEYAMAHAKPGDLILTLGGGDIYKCANLIVEKYKNEMALEAAAR